MVLTELSQIAITYLSIIEFFLVMFIILGVATEKDQKTDIFDQNIKEDVKNEGHH